MITRLFAFVWKDWQQARSYRLAFFLQLGGFALPLVGLYFLTRLFGDVEMGSIKQYGGNYVTFLLTGIIVTTYSGVALQAFSGHLRSAQFMGTLEVLLLTRTSVPVIVLGGALYSILRSTLVVAIYLIGGFLILGIQFAGSNLWGALVTLILMVTIMASMGLLAAGFTLVFKQGDPFTSIMMVAAGLLSGTAYPVSILPKWLQVVAQVLPQTHAIEGMRLAVLQGYSVGDLAPQLVALAVYAVILVPLALVGFRYAMHRARVEGSLAHY